MNEILSNMLGECIRIEYGDNDRLPAQGVVRALYLAAGGHPSSLPVPFAWLERNDYAHPAMTFIPLSGDIYVMKRCPIGQCFHIEFQWFNAKEMVDHVRICHANDGDK